jgi:hypothetical protein
MHRHIPSVDRRGSVTSTISTLPTPSSTVRPVIMPVISIAGTVRLTVASADPRQMLTERCSRFA